MMPFTTPNKPLRTQAIHDRHPHRGKQTESEKTVVVAVPDERHEVADANVAHAVNPHERARQLARLGLLRDRELNRAERAFGAEKGVDAKVGGQQPDDECAVAEIRVRHV